MLFKLSVRNMRRSVRDYAIYFFTLAFAVTIFYAFNSIGDQHVMEDIQSSNSSNIVEFTKVMMTYFSIAIAFVFGFLVIYANQLLINRRKHEFGIYLTLGMKPSQISRVVLYETVFIGLISLVLGLGLGILVSQLLSFATAVMFNVPMPGYQFEFSQTAFLATLLCFVFIYIVVAVFNIVSVRRYKLIDLMNARGKSQKVAIRNPWLCLVFFIVSLVLIGCAYWQLSINGMTLIFDENFTAATILMLVGTFLFFFSLAGFLIAVLTKRKSYYKGLKPFTTRQIASKVNTSFISMWIICVMLFLGITTFTSGMGLVEAFTGDIDKANPYDASIIFMDRYETNSEMQAESEQAKSDVYQGQERLQENITDWDKLVEKSAVINIYDLPNLTYGQVMEETRSTLDGSSLSSMESVSNQNIDVVSVSQFNDMLAMAGKPALVLREGEYAVDNTMSAFVPIANAMTAQSYAIDTPIGELRAQSKVQQLQLYNYDILSCAAILVVPDELVDVLAQTEGPTQSVVNITFVPTVDFAMLAQDAAVTGSDISKLTPSSVFYSRAIDIPVYGMTNVLTRELMIEQAMGLRMSITYLAVYIGLVMLIVTAAILAIQLLALTIDSAGRYKKLSQLGCDGRMLNRSLFAQVCLYFAAPLVLAICHSYCAVSILSDTLFTAIGTDIIPSVVMTCIFLLLIYGGYLLITYFASRSTMRQSL